jgi:hypothetical protein
MATSEERMKILKMIEEGKLSVEEGSRLFVSLAKHHQPSSLPAVQKPGDRACWLRVRVTDAKTGKSKATVNLPVGMVDVGLNIAAQYAPEVAFDELRESITAGAQGKIIEVFDEEDGENVEIIIE